MHITDGKVGWVVDGGAQVGEGSFGQVVKYSGHIAEIVSCGLCIYTSYCHVCIIAI